MDQNLSPSLLTMKQFMGMIGIKSRTTVYKRLKKQCLPPPCSIGLGRLRWRERDVREWIDGLGPA